MDSDSIKWHKLFKFSKFKDEQGLERYKVHLKYTNESIGYGTSPDLAGAYSVAFNYFNNFNNKKKMMDALTEYILLLEE